MILGAHFDWGAAASASEHSREVQPCEVPSFSEAYFRRSLELLKLETPENLVHVLVLPWAHVVLASGMPLEYGVAVRATTEGPKIVAVRARESIWATNFKNFAGSTEAVPVPLDQWEAPIDNACMGELWRAFQRQARQMSFATDRFSTPGGGWRYRFYVIVMGFGSTCGRLDVQFDGRSRYVPTRLAETMVKFAMSPPEERAAIRDELLRLARVLSVKGSAR